MTPPKLTDEQINDCLESVIFNPRGWAHAIADLRDQQWQEMLEREVVAIYEPETLATQIGFAMRLADAPLSEAQFVTLCCYLKARAEE